MAINFKVGSMTLLGSDESVLHCIPSIKFASFKALPTYRLFFPLLLLNASLYITDRRILIVTYLFGLRIQKFSAWYPDRGPEDDQEIVVSIRTGRLGILGDYLEVVSYNNNRPWYYRYLCSPMMRMRFYMKNPELLYESMCSVLEVMTGGVKRYY